MKILNEEVNRIKSMMGLREELNEIRVPREDWEYIEINYEHTRIHKKDIKGRD